MAVAPHARTLAAAGAAASGRAAAVTARSGRCSRLLCGFAPARAPAHGAGAGPARGGPFTLGCRRFCDGAQEGGRRGGGAAAAQEEEEEALNVTMNADVARLGAAIAARLRTSGRATLRSIGHQAAYRGIKALVTALDYLRDDPGAPEGRELAVEPSEVAMDQGRSRAGAEGEPARKSVLFMRARAVVAGPRPGALAVTKELVVGAQTNAGRAAAAIAGVMRPGAMAADVRAMGAAAVHQALIAAVQAQRYLDTDGKGVKFVVVPSFREEAAAGNDARRIRQLVLRMIRADRLEA